MLHHFRVRQHFSVFLFSGRLYLSPFNFCCDFLTGFLSRTHAHTFCIDFFLFVILEGSGQKWTQNVLLSNCSRSSVLSLSAKCVKILLNWYLSTESNAKSFLYRFYRPKKWWWFLFYLICIPPINKWGFSRPFLLASDLFHWFLCWIWL